MAVTINIKIEAKVLKWARESSGLTIDDVACHFGQASLKRYKINKDAALLMETHSQEISFQLIKELAKLYKRPIPSFFLKKPPHALPLPKDFRTLSSEVNYQLSKETMLMIRRVRRVQEVTRELYDDMGMEYKFEFKKYSMADDPNKLANFIREKLDLNFEKQKSLKDQSMLFEYLRTAIENAGAIVLKGSFPLDDARAFSFVDKKPYVIVVNNKDGNETGFAPKLFSLMHEFAHILLRESAICNDFLYSHIKIEKFCNQFAGEFLMPTDSLLEVLPIRLKSNISADNIDAIVKDLKSKFKVSQQVILRRLLVLGYVGQHFYETISKKWKDDYDDGIISRGKTFVPIISQDQKALNNYGKLFTRLVLEAQYTNHITTSSAAEYLGIKAKHMPNLYNLALKSL